MPKRKAAAFLVEELVMGAANWSCVRTEILWRPFAYAQGAADIQRNAHRFLMGTVPPFAALLVWRAAGARIPIARPCRDFPMSGSALFEDFDFQNSDLTATRRKPSSGKRSRPRLGGIGNGLVARRIRKRYPKQSD